MTHPEANRSPLISLDIPVAPTENTSITQLTQWLTQKFAQYERWDNGIGKTFQILPSYSASALPGTYTAELIGFFAASEALSLRIQNVSILHVEALDQELKSRLLYTPQGRKQFAKDFSSQDRVLAEKLPSYYPSLSLSDTDITHMHIGASAAKILYDLTKRPYSEVSKQTARDRGKYQVVPGGVKIPLDAKE